MSGWNEGEREGREGEERMQMGRECALHCLYLLSDKLQEHHKTQHAKEAKCLVILESSNAEIYQVAGVLPTRWGSQTHLFNGLAALRWIGGQCSE